MPRVFVAAPLPREACERLAASLPETPGLRVLPPDLVHVTLAFLGQVGEEQVAGVVAAAQAAARGRSAFTLRLDRLGRFPEHGPPGVVWASGPDSAALAELAAAVRAELGRRRLPFDPKPLRAHVTLARLARDPTVAEARVVAEAVRRARVEPVAIEVAQVAVLESRLGPHGPRYSSRARIALMRPRGAQTEAPERRGRAAGPERGVRPSEGRT